MRARTSGAGGSAELRTLLAATLALAPGATARAGGVIDGLPQAERFGVSATATSGSGLSIAGAGGRLATARSPFALVAEVGFTHPQLAWLEFSPALLLELEGRVGVGVAPKIRAHVPERSRRWDAWGIAAVPAFFAPYSLLGVQVGAGVGFVAHSRLQLVAEAVASAYVWGSDRMDDAALGKLDLLLGVRVTF
jgi:hypothetical protein